MRNKAAVVAALTALLLLGGAPMALAQTPDPGTVSAVNNGFAELETLVVTVLAVALFSITVLVIGVLMGVRWLKKGARAG